MTILIRVLWVTVHGGKEGTSVSTRESRWESQSSLGVGLGSVGGSNSSVRATELIRGWPRSGEDIRGGAERSFRGNLSNILRLYNTSNILTFRGNLRELDKVPREVYSNYIPGLCPLSVA